jgi:antitoxin HicB
MLTYPVDLQSDTNGTLLVTFPEFVEAVTYGDDESDALLRAEGALETMLAARIDDREDIPLPSPAAGRPCVVLPALTAAKVLLYRAMREAGVRKADLARRLGWHGPQIDRLLDLNHASRLDQIEAALAVLGKRLKIDLADAA